MNLTIDDIRRSMARMSVDDLRRIAGASNDEYAPEIRKIASEELYGQNAFSAVAHEPDIRPEGATERAIHYVKCHPLGFGISSMGAGFAAEYASLFLEKLFLVFVGAALVLTGISVIIYGVKRKNSICPYSLRMVPFDTFARHSGSARGVMDIWWVQILCGALLLWNALALRGDLQALEAGTVDSLTVNILVAWIYRLFGATAAVFGVGLLGIFMLCLGTRTFLRKNAAPGAGGHE